MDKKEFIEIMEETCFGSLAFCCGKEKECNSRDLTIKKLGITKKDFFELKKQFTLNLYSLVNSKELKRKNENKKN